MWLDLLDGLELGAEPTAVGSVEGRTPSREDAVGRRWAWGLSVSGLPLALWETQWSTGEREFVLADQEMGDPAPVMVTKLMSRRRALVERHPDFEYMSARRVDPDVDGWPRFSACSDTDIAQLVPPRASEQLTGIGYRGTATRLEALGATGPNRQQLVAIFAPESRAAAAGFYTLTRVVPTLKRAGLLRG